MSRPVLLETNWLVDVALNRNQASADIRHQGLQGEIDLLVPSVCLVEAIKLLEIWQTEWRRAELAIELAAGIPGREETLVHFAQLQERVHQELWSTVEEASSRARIVQLDFETIRLSRDIRGFLDLDPADSIVLATAVRMSSSGDCREFVSRDRRAFDTEPTRAFMVAQGITYYADPADFLKAV